jgi:hypothetical protein
MTKSASFWWGCFGAVLPQAVRFFLLVANGHPLPTLNWFLYGLLLLPYVLSAGLFSVGWKPENEFKAIWVGASLPALVSAIVNAAPSLPGGGG